MRSDGYSDTERLDLFLRRAESLLSSQIMQAGELTSRFTINYCAIKSQMRVDTWQPDDASLESFVLRFRHFWGENEPARATRIHSVLWINTQSDYVKEQLKQASAHWKQTQRSGKMGL